MNSIRIVIVLWWKWNLGNDQLRCNCHRCIKYRMLWCNFIWVIISFNTLGRWLGRRDIRSHRWLGTLTSSPWPLPRSSWTSLTISIFFFKFCRISSFIIFTPGKDAIRGLLWDFDAEGKTVPDSHCFHLLLKNLIIVNNVKRYIWHLGIIGMFSEQCSPKIP